MEKKMRRNFVKTILFGMMMSTLGLSASATEAWPSRPIRFVIPQGPGSGNDVLARSLAEQLGKELNQTIIVENRPGANGVLAARTLLSQPSDGYTMFMAGVSNLSWNPHLYSDLPYDPIQDFDGVAIFADTPFVSIISPTLGIKTLEEFRQLIQKNPGKYSFASAGIGNSTHLSSELIMRKVGLEMQHVPFNGPGSTTSVMSGDTPFMTTVPGGVTPMIESGKLVAIAVTGEKRLKLLPDVPTYKELGYDITVPGWYSIVMKKGTDPQIIDRLNLAINKALRSEEMKKGLAFQSLEPVHTKPEDVRAYIERDSTGWANLIQELGIKQ
jgi:tripartite-type tricarboxylate transporter receptor subunit TctC